jgi:hypothetical protein
VNTPPVLYDRACAKKTNTRNYLRSNSRYWLLIAGHLARYYRKDRCAEAYQNVRPQTRRFVH